MSFQLFVEGDRLGALNLYGADANAFDSESEQVGLLVAAHAAVAFAGSQKISQLGEALVSRQLIGQAEGILMERYKLTAERLPPPQPGQLKIQHQTPGYCRTPHQQRRIYRSPARR